MFKEPLGFPTDLIPVVVGEAFLIGVGEENNLSAFQRKEFGRREFIHAACGHPEKVCVDLRHNDGRLLGFHHGHRLLGMTRLHQQMRTEEAVGGLKRKDQLWIIPKIEVVQF